MNGLGLGGHAMNRMMRLSNRATAIEIFKKQQVGPRPTDGNGWYRIKNLANQAGHVEIYMYDEIGFWGVSAAEFVRQLQGLEAVHIDLRINSPGGDAWDGIAIYNALCNHPAAVTTYVDGLAASAASFIAQAGGKVIVARNATMMIHDAEGICIGNCTDMREMADLLDRTSNNIADIYAQRCSTVLQWRKSMKAVSWYVGQEAVDSGLADELYEPEQGSDDQPAERRRKANANAGNQKQPSPVNRTARPISTACPTHNTTVVSDDDGSWEGIDGLTSPLPITTAQKMYGWYDGTQVSDGEIPQSACALPHHVVNDDGTPGAAHLTATQEALDGLENSDVPEGERDAVMAHLQAHLDDGIEVGSVGDQSSTGSDDPANQVTNFDDLASWWDPELFRTAVATAANQNALYGFDPEAFREIMRAASINCPAPAETPEVKETPPPLKQVDIKEFREAMKRGLL